MGELIAWIIGWDLVLEYAVGAATVAISWSEYFNKVLEFFGTRVPYQWSHSPLEAMPGTPAVHGILNIPAVVILGLMSALLVRGTQESAFVNNRGARGAREGASVGPPPLVSAFHGGGHRPFVAPHSSQEGAMHDRDLSDLGRMVYGAGAVALGLIGVASGDFATIWHPVPPDLPGRQALAYLAAVCLLAAGAATCWRRTARVGGSVLAALYLVFAALWVRRVIGFPQLYGTWGGMLEQLVPVIAGGVIALAPADDDSAQAARATEIGRMLLGICALSFGVTHFTAVPQTAAMVPAWIPPGQRFWAILTGVCDLLAGLALLSGVAAVLAARLLTAMLVGFGVFVWAPRLLASPVTHNAWGGNAINLVISGAVWVVADAIARRQRDTRTNPRLVHG